MIHAIEPYTKSPYFGFALLRLLYGVSDALDGFEVVLREGGVVVDH